MNFLSCLCFFTSQVYNCVPGSFLVFTLFFHIYLRFLHSMSDQLSDVQNHVNSSHISDRLYSLAYKWLRYRLNIHFISSALSSKFIPKGFRLSSPPPMPSNTPNRVALCSIWDKHLDLCSTTLMKLTCSFYACELPNIQLEINELAKLCNTDIITRLNHQLSILHRNICITHCKKYSNYGRSFQASTFTSPFLLYISSPPSRPSPTPSPLDDSPHTPPNTSTHRMHTSSLSSSPIIITTPPTPPPATTGETEGVYANALSPSTITITTPPPPPPPPVAAGRIEGVHASALSPSPITTTTHSSTPPTLVDSLHTQPQPSPPCADDSNASTLRTPPPYLRASEVPSLRLAPKAKKVSVSRPLNKPTFDLPSPASVSTRRVTRSQTRTTRNLEAHLTPLPFLPTTPELNSQRKSTVCSPPFDTTPPTTPTAAR